MFLLYNGLLLLPRLAAAPIGAWLSGREGMAAAEWAQRLGHHPTPISPSGVWIQAASIGEVRVASGLIASLAARRPGLPVFLTTTTRTGQALARSLDLPSVRLGYFPLDFPATVRRVLDAVRPRAFVMVETELWPNLLRACGRSGVRTLVVNGRISSRSLARYRLVSPLMRRALGYLDVACVQTREDGQRFEKLGLRPERIRVTGNLKYDFPTPPGRTEATAFRALAGLREKDFLIVAGSTAEGEDRLVLDAFESVRKHHPAVRLLIAPRHPERFRSAAEEAAGRGLSVRSRSDAGESGPADVLVLDTLGELPLAYAAAQAAFVGGSLVPAGGQNLLEPAACGLAPIFGPDTANFREPAERLLQAGAGVRVRDAGELASALRAAILNPEACRAAGERARRAVEAGGGATDRSLRAVEEMLDDGREAA